MRRIGRDDDMAGIAVFLGVGEPIGKSGTATGIEWIVGFGFCISISTFAVIVTRGAQPHNRALGLAVATGAMATLAWRRSRPVGTTTAVTATWWKFLVAGPCLAALVIIATGQTGADAVDVSSAFEKAGSGA